MSHTGTITFTQYAQQGIAQLNKLKQKHPNIAEHNLFRTLMAMSELCAQLEAAWNKLGVGNQIKAKASQLGKKTAQEVCLPIITDYHSLLIAIAYNKQMQYYSEVNSSSPLLRGALNELKADTATAQQELSDDIKRYCREHYHMILAIIRNEQNSIDTESSAPSEDELNTLLDNLAIAAGIREPAQALIASAEVTFSVAVDSALEGIYQYFASIATDSSSSVINLRELESQFDYFASLLKEQQVLVESEPSIPNTDDELKKQLDDTNSKVAQAAKIIGFEWSEKQSEVTAPETKLLSLYQTVTSAYQYMSDKVTRVFGRLNPQDNTVPVGVSQAEAFRNKVAAAIKENSDIFKNNYDIHSKPATAEEISDAVTKINLVSTIAIKTETLKRSIAEITSNVNQFIKDHNIGLVKFNDFFSPINRLLSKTFFKYVMHDNTLLIEKARDFLKSLKTIESSIEQLDQSASDDVVARLAEIQHKLLTQQDVTKDRISQIRGESCYPFYAAQRQTAAVQLERSLSCVVAA